MFPLTALGRPPVVRQGGLSFFGPAAASRSGNFEPAAASESGNRYYDARADSRRQSTRLPREFPAGRPERHPEVSSVLPLAVRVVAVSIRSRRTRRRTPVGGRIGECVQRLPRRHRGLNPSSSPVTIISTRRGVAEAPRRVV